jgi:Mg-chelatase subunit ChlD
MNSHVFRVTTAFLTFFVGITVAAAWVFNTNEPKIEPVSVDESSVRPSSATLEMVFVLDTTGSMGGLLDGAKQRIWGIVNDVMQTEARPAVRIGLVAYRDRGDQYVTQVLPLTNDLDQVYSVLMGYQADGGGDTPEDVRRALIDGVTRAAWSAKSDRVAQILFLVGDAPPHDDYRDVPDTRSTAAEAAKKGMVVNTIQCGRLPGTQEVWQAIAQRGNGQYFSIAQDGGVQTIATPYDEQLGQLATKLGGTYVAYGGGAGAEGERNRVVAAEMAARSEVSVATSAPAAAKAERALNKAVNATAYIGDLLQNIENGSVQIDKLKEEDLPQDLRKMPAEQRKQEIEKRLAERRELRAQIISLSKQRAEFIATEQKKLGSKQGGFDAAVSIALKEQLKRKGIK